MASFNFRVSSRRPRQIIRCTDLSDRARTAVICRFEIKMKLISGCGFRTRKQGSVERGSFASWYRTANDTPLSHPPFKGQVGFKGTWCEVVVNPSSLSDCGQFMVKRERCSEHMKYKEWVLDDRRLRANGNCNR
jgi:hypothetical protein